MLTFPNSSAMDATASSGGPITVLPQIVGGQPEQIAKHVAALVKALGAVDLAQQVTTLAQVIGEIEKLFHHGSGSSGATTPSIGNTPVRAPQTPAPVASPSGQQAVAGGSGGGIPQQPSFTDYTPPALATGGGSSTGGGTAVSGNGTPLN